MPEVCPEAPAALEGLVLPMRGRRGSPPHRQAGMVGHSPHAGQAWGPAAGVLRTMVEIAAPGGEVGTPRLPPFPPPLQTVAQTVPGPCGGDALQQQCIPRWQEAAHWRHGGVWVNSVGSGEGRDAALATPGQRTNLDDRGGLP